MNLYLIIFTSGTYKKECIYEAHKDLFVELEKSFTLHLVNCTEAENIPANAYKMAFLADGEAGWQVIHNFSLFPYPVTILADGLNNSLAAALEVAAYIQMKDMRVRIIHGTAAQMASQVLLHHRAFAAKRSLKGKRIGVIGTPAAWLVASHVDYYLTSQRWGVSYIDIPLEEVYRRFYATTDDQVGPEASLFAHRAQACQDITPDDLLRDMRLHRAIRLLCEEEGLDAVTLSYTQLAAELDTSGCLALSLLNDEGIPAGSEGDLQAVMSMLMARAVTGEASFMGNPAFIDTQKNEIRLTHCSIPTCMTETFILRDHFDTGKGVAIQGLMHEGNITLFKCGGECLDEFYTAQGYLAENQNLSSSCRTQFRIKLESPVSYFLENPLGNHHVLVRGNHAEAFREFMRQNRCKQRT